MEIADRLRAALAGRYELERELGRGGMAVVYLARDVRHERRVAVKVMRPELAASIAADRFLREIHIAGELQHPLIVPLYDSGETPDGSLWYVMPYVQGETLRQRLNREQQLPLQDALQIARDAAEALSDAHAHGVVHRDIKPENILLSGGHALIADFGLARALTQAAGGFTSSGLVVGTPEYMSPEQGSGNKTLDARSDVYSLGCVLYEMLAGEPPFTGPTPQAVIAKHVSERVPSVRVMRPGAPEALDAVVQSALAKVPADRMESASALRQALDVGGMAPVTGGRGWRWRRWAVLGGLGVAAAVLWALERTTASGERPENRLDPNHIAVLFFDDLSPDRSLGYVARGLTADLIDALSRVEALSVVPPSGVAQFAGRAASLDSIARALQVGTLVEGSVARRGDVLRITVRLDDASLSRQVGSQTLERPLSDFFRLQDDLVAQVARFLRERLGREITIRERRARAPSFDAWRLVQLAEDARGESEDQLKKGNAAAAERSLLRADSLLAAAERTTSWIDPTLLRGWVALDYASVVEAGQGAESPAARAPLPGRKSVAGWLAAGLAHAARVLRRHPDDPRGLELRGTLRVRLLHLVGPREATALADSAQRDLLAAVEADPLAARAWVSLSRVYGYRGELGAAALAATRAVEADAYLTEADRTLANSFFAALREGNVAAARSLCSTGRKYYAMEPTFRECRLTILGWSGHGGDDIEQAWHELGAIEAGEGAQTLHETWGYRRLMVAAVLARSGLADSARHVVRGVRSVLGSDTSANFAEAYVSTLLGDTHHALDLLRGLLRAYPQRREFVATHPWFQSLRGNPTFDSLARPQP